MLFSCHGDVLSVRATWHQFSLRAVQVIGGYSLQKIHHQTDCYIHALEWKYMSKGILLKGQQE